MVRGTILAKFYDNSPVIFKFSANEGQTAVKTESYARIGSSTKWTHSHFFCSSGEILCLQIYHWRS